MNSPEKMEAEETSSQPSVTIPSTKADESSSSSTSQPVKEQAASSQEPSCDENSSSSSVHYVILDQLSNEEEPFLKDYIEISEKPWHKENGNLILEWKNSIPDDVSHEIVIEFWQSEKKVKIDNAEFHGTGTRAVFTPPDPSKYYFAKMWIYSSVEGYQNTESPIEIPKKRLCTPLKQGGNIFVDYSQQLAPEKEVYIGYINTKQVVIKFLNKDVKNEINILSHLTESPKANVVTYFTSDKMNEFGEKYYIAMERCGPTLEEILPKLTSMEEKMKVLEDLATGLAVIHSANVIHRDLKPANILLSLDQKSYKLADFGFSKKRDKLIFSNSRNHMGSVGWCSPEQYNSDTLTTACDIYSAGLVFFYVLSGKRHVYGDNWNAWVYKISHEEFKISRDNVILEGLRCRESELAYDLLYRMLSYNPDDRPNASQVLAHPFFWDNEKKLSFIHRIKQYLIDSRSDNQDEIDTKRMISDKLQASFPYGNWMARIPNEILNLKYWLGGKEKSFRDGYDAFMVSHLIRYIRNTEEHFISLVELRNFFGDDRNNIWPFFSDKYPQLLVLLYKTIAEWNDSAKWSSPDGFKSFSSNFEKFFGTA